jgi:lysophospholipase L1-like esterase
MSKKKTKWWQKLLLAVISPLVFLLLAEGAIRLLGVNTDLARNKNFKIGVPVWLLADQNWVHNVNYRLGAAQGVDAADVAWLAHFEEARYIQYRLKPRIDIQAVNPFNDTDVRKNITFRITSNSQGFRTKEFAPKKPGTFRIVTLGDSGTFGWGVDAASTWQLLLEKRLDSAASRVEVLNLGISGHTTRHGLNVLRHYAWDLKPDLIVISYGANDARYVRQTVDSALAPDDTFLGGIRWTLLKLKTVQLLRKWIFSLHDPLEPTVKVHSPDVDPSAGLRAVPPGRYEANLRTMIAEARQRGVTVVLLSLCVPPEYNRIMAGIAQDECVPFIDGKQFFLDRFEDVRDGRAFAKEMATVRSIYGDESLARDSWLYVTSDGCHPNPVGTNIIADALAAAVQSAVSEAGTR